MVVWKSPRLAAKMHSIPHVNFCMEPVHNNFDMDSSSYIISLVVISLIPLFAAIIVLLVIFIYWFWRLLIRIDGDRRKPDDEPCEETISCICQRQALLLILLFVTMLILVLGLIFEIILHSRIVEICDKFEETLFLSSDSIDVGMYPKTISDAFMNSSMSFQHPLKKFSNTSFAKDLDQLVLKRYRKLYGTFADDMLTILSRIENPLEKYAPVRLNCKFLTTFRVSEYVRYVLFMISWCIGIVFVPLVLLFRWKVMLLGILWFVLMSSWLLPMAVALGDLCQHNPANFVERYINIKVLDEEVREKKLFLCRKFNSQVNMNINDYKKRYIEWGVAFDEMLRRHKNVNKKKEEKAFKETDLVYNYLYYVNETISVNVEKNVYNVFDKVPRLSCDGTSSRLGYQDTPIYNMRLLCENDNVLFWMVLQLYMVLFIGLAFVYLLLLYISMMRDISYYYRGAENSASLGLLRLETSALRNLKMNLKLFIEKHLLGLEPCPQSEQCITSGLICRSCRSSRGQINSGADPRMAEPVTNVKPVTNDSEPQTTEDEPQITKAKPQTVNAEPQTVNAEP